jgi:hypothetical protein
MRQHPFHLVHHIIKHILLKCQQIKSTKGKSTYQEIVKPRVKFFELLGVELLQNCTLDSEEFSMAVFKVPEQPDSFVMPVGRNGFKNRGSRRSSSSGDQLRGQYLVFWRFSREFWSYGRDDEDFRRSTTLFYPQSTSSTFYPRNQLLSAAI